MNANKGIKLLMGAVPAQISEWPLTIHTLTIPSWVKFGWLSTEQLKEY